MTVIIILIADKSFQCFAFYYRFNNNYALHSIALNSQFDNFSLRFQFRSRYYLIILLLYMYWVAQAKVAFVH